jgi:hypothetical protein
MDDEFVRRVRQAFPDTRLEMNHRYLGHWGFQGSIPFRQEPYQRALAAYPRKELATLWQSFCDELVERSMKATGLPERQARAYAGLHYNMHLLGDLGPGNAVIDPLPEPGLIIRDIEKNLRRLFGNRSHIAKEVTEELLAIPAQPPEHFAVAARRVMAKYPVGEALWKNYGDALQKAGVRQFSSKGEKAIADLLLKTNANLADELVPEQMLDQVFQPRQSIPRALPAGMETHARQGVMQKVTVKGKSACAISVPVDPTLAARLGMEAGVLTLFFTEGITVYQYCSGRIDNAQFKADSARNLAEALATGAATYIVVAIGVSPAGWGILAVGVGTALLTNVVFDRLRDGFQGETFSLEDFVGRLPTQIQNRRTTWDNDGGQTILDFNEGRRTVFNLADHGTAFRHPERNTVFEPGPPGKGALE